MNYSRREMMAIYKMAKTMAAADGHVDIKELTIIAAELNAFGVHDEELLNAADAMDADDALSVLRGMTTDEKKYVCGYLAAISAVDGDLDAKEIAVWQLVSTLANFPTMSFAEALTFWRTH